MPIREITCADCGHFRRARNRNTKYCHKCRLLRNLEYHSNTVRLCSHCKAEFAPIDVKDPCCGEHTLGYSTLRGDCRYCNAENAFLARPDVPVCLSCVRKPTLRARLINALQRGQADRIANPPVIREEACI